MSTETERLIDSIMAAQRPRYEGRLTLAEIRDRFGADLPYLVDLWGNAAECVMERLADGMPADAAVDDVWDLIEATTEKFEAIVGVDVSAVRMGQIEIVMEDIAKQFGVPVEGN